jgi:hypothetical protein
MNLRIISSRQGFILTVIVISLIFTWSPWLTEEYATVAVVDSLGGPNQEYNYLGEMIALRDVPKTVTRVPFGALVYFSSEAMFIVTFWGGVI